MGKIGGRREGAGRPHGSTDSYQRVRSRKRVVLEPLRGDGTPLAHLLSVMNDESVPDRRRDEAAVKAARFCHLKARLPDLDLEFPSPGVDWERLLLPDIDLGEFPPKLPWEKDD